MAGLVAVLARSKGRSGRRREASMSTTERWQASLTSSQRGRLVTRMAATRELAIAAAMRMLDDASDLTQMHGERIAVEIEAAD
jgi:hypothetical protein